MILPGGSGVIGGTRSVARSAVATAFARLRTFADTQRSDAAVASGRDAVPLAVGYRFGDGDGGDGRLRAAKHETRSALVDFQRNKVRSPARLLAEIVSQKGVAHVDREDDGDVVGAGL